MYPPPPPALLPPPSLHKLHTLIYNDETKTKTGSSPAQQNILFTLGALPWSFKLVYGFISDNFPIGGKRRKPYFIIGWAVYVMVNLYTATKEVPR